VTADASSREPITHISTPAIGLSVHSGRHRTISVLVFLTLAAAPNEGYLLALNANLAKVLPAALCFSWILHLVRAHRLPEVTTTHVLCVALLVVVIASGAINSSGTFVLLYVARWLPFLILTIVLIDLLSTIVPVRVAVAGLVAGAAVSGVGAIYSFAVLQDGRASGPLHDPNDLAYVLVTALPFAMIHRVPFGSGWRRSVLVLVSLTLVVGAAMTLSRGGLVAALVALAWAVCRRLVSLRKTAAWALLLTLGGLLTIGLLSPHISAALSQKSFIAQANVNGRELRWEAASRMIADHPLLGVGPGGFRTEYVAASGNAELVEQDPVTHNMYLEVGSELGLVGLMLFVGVILAAAHESENAYSRGDRVGLAAQGSLLTACVASIFLSEEYYLALWAAIAIAAAAGARPAAGQ
jgi:putative inorganic carbon (HCO3(-)) transporter